MSNRKDNEARAERMTQMAELRLEEWFVERSSPPLRRQDAHPANVVPHSALAAEAPAEPIRRRKSKGPADATLCAIAAIAAVIHRENLPAGGAAGLARKAAERAQELGLQGADALNPSNSSMRDIAQAFINGIHAEAAAPDC